MSSLAKFQVNINITQKKLIAIAIIGFMFSISTAGAIIVSATGTPIIMKTVIEPGSMTADASYIIFKDDAGYTCARNGTSGAIDYRSTNTSLVLSTITDGSIFFKKGTYYLTTNFIVPENSWIKGEGNTTILTATNQESILLGHSNSMLSDVQVTGGLCVNIQATNGTHISDITVHDVNINIGSLSQAAIMVMANGSKAWLSYVSLYNINIVPGCFGVLVQGTGPTSLIDNVTMTDIHVIDAGLNSRYNDWVTAFDLREKGTVRDMIVTRCSAVGSWESGFHTEQIYPSVKNIVLRDCYSGNNGQKPTPSFGNGFMIAGGESLYNCIAENNKNAGYDIVNNFGPQAYLFGCVDRGSGTGFFSTATVYRIELHNCISYNATGVGIVFTNVFAQSILDNCAVYNSGAEGIDFEACANIAGSLLVSTAGSDSYKHATAVLGSVSYGVYNINLTLTIDTLGAVNDRALMIHGSNVSIDGSSITAVNSGAGISFLGTYSGAGLSYDCKISNMNMYLGATNAGVDTAGFAYRTYVTNVNFFNTIAAQINYGVIGTGDVITRNLQFTGNFYNPNKYYSVLKYSNSGEAVITTGQTTTLITTGTSTMDWHYFHVIPYSATIASFTWGISAYSATQFELVISSTAAANITFFWSYDPGDP